MIIKIGGKFNKQEMGKEGNKHDEASRNSKTNFAGYYAKRFKKKGSKYVFQKENPDDYIDDGMQHFYA